MDALKGLTALPLTIVTSVLLIFLGVVYFVIALLIVNVSAGLVLCGGFDCPDASGLDSWILLSAGLITAASLVGAAIQKEE